MAQAKPTIISRGERSIVTTLADRTWGGSVIAHKGFIRETPVTVSEPRKLFPGNKTRRGYEITAVATSSLPSLTELERGRMPEGAKVVHQSVVVRRGLRIISMFEHGADFGSGIRKVMASGTSVSEKASTGSR